MPLMFTIGVSLIAAVPIFVVLSFIDVITKTQSDRYAWAVVFCLIVGSIMVILTPFVYVDQLPFN